MLLDALNKSRFMHK